MAGCFHTFVLMLTYYFALGACYTAPMSNQLESVPEKVLTAHAQARVETLPGYPGKLPSAHYSGYLPIQNRQISPKVFYYLATSERDPTKDPLILILPGGPRCSSFSSFLYENGPLRPQAGDGEDADDLDPKVSLRGNPFSWSKVANVLYIDTTTGTGLSYAPDKEDEQKLSDTSVTEATAAFLQSFFEEYNEFQPNPLFIAGHGYGGILVPMLAHSILISNSRPEALNKINIQGYMIGNGLTDPSWDMNGYIPYKFYKGTISSDVFSAVFNTCNGNFYQVEPGSPCDTLMGVMENETTLLNPWNIMQPCAHPNATEAEKVVARLYGMTPLQRRTWPLGPLLPIGPFSVRSMSDLLPMSPGTIRCLDHREIYDWLGDPKVREAIHAAPENVTGPFRECASDLPYTHNTGTLYMMHMLLITKGLRALIYSGDMDSVVPHVGTETWTRALALKVEQGWRPWLSFGSDSTAKPKILEFWNLRMPAAGWRSDVVGKGSS